MYSVHKSKGLLEVQALEVQALEVQALEVQALKMGPSFSWVFRNLNGASMFATDFFL